MPIQKTEKVWHNGKFIAWDDATIHVMSHVVHYGSSVFEGIRCYALPQRAGDFPRHGTHATAAQFGAHLPHRDAVHSRRNHGRHAGAGQTKWRVALLCSSGDSARLWRSGRESAQTRRSKSTSAIIRGENIWARTRARAWMCASPPGRGLLPTRCPRWPRPARIT